MIDLEKINENNLFELYRQAASCLNGTYKQPDFEYPIYKNQGWPIFTYNINPTINSLATIDNIKIHIKEKKAPPYLILEYNNQTTPFINQLKQSGFIAIDVWPKMGLILENKTPQGTYPPEFCFNPDIDSWLNLINQVQFKDCPLSRSQMESLLKNKSVKTVGIIKDSKLISGCLIFEHKKNLGIYMVSTSPAYQKQGWGSKLVKGIIDSSIASNQQTLTLQANRKSEKIYSSYGFKTTSYYLILWHNETL